MKRILSCSVMLSLLHLTSFSVCLHVNNTQSRHAIQIITLFHFFFLASTALKKMYPVVVISLFFPSMSNDTFATPSYRHSKSGTEFQVGNYNDHFMIGKKKLTLVYINLLLSRIIFSPYGTCENEKKVPLSLSRP